MASWVVCVGAAFVIIYVVLEQASARVGRLNCPSSCACLGNLVDCSQRGLIEIPKDLPDWVEMLELQRNDIIHIPDDIFKDLISLQNLDLSHNQLRSINATAFQHLTNLRELKIHNNHLSEMPNLGHLPNLTVFNLQHNEIHNISLSVLEGLSYLRSLYLNHNRIVDIAVGSFPNNSRLLHLFLNNNRINNIEEGSLDNLTNVETLVLNKNRLSNLPKDLFKKLRTLRTLELKHNRLKVIEGLSFSGLESLQKLHLQNNVIDSLLDGAFWGLSNIQQLKLDYNNITVVAKGWLYGLASLKQLSLRHNSIVQIEDDGWEFCQQLRDLELENNQLQAIRRGMFLKLGKLHTLNLNHNRISYIEDGAFRGLSSLEKLKMNKNEISWTIEDMNGAFSGLDQLTRLDLVSNVITSIAKRAFVGLDSLKHLDLGDNAITSIQNNAFQGMHYLQHLNLSSTTLLCDCELQWLPEWLTQAGFHTSVTARCAHPEWLKGKSIFEIDKEDFTCDDYPKPFIMENPQTRSTLKGSNITLICRAGSSSTSQMRFQWKKDNMIVKNPHVTLYANTTSGDITEYRSTFMLYNISYKDEGRYQCVITNDFGSTYSQKAKITVHVFPVFLKTPEDVVVRSGNMARLECAATGQPPPVIAWQKDGGDDFPAARERRMHVMPTDDVFFIVSVKTADMGVYSCTAENAAGMIIANATLTVLETPAFVKALEDKKTEVGETTVLECKAKGSPKPKLTWTKDGRPILPSERHFFTADNQLLIIVPTQYSDEGTYTCEMSNTLGMERGMSQLKVVSPHQVLLEDESATAGIIIIAVVCCIVGTSLIWVIIIYRTRKRSEDFSRTSTDETTLPEELTYPSYPTTTCASALQVSAAHLYMDNHSDHSSKDSGTGESTRQSEDGLLSSSHPGCPLETRGLAINEGSSLVSLNEPPSDSSLDTLTSTPSTHTTSSGDAFPSRPTNHERLVDDPELDSWSMMPTCPAANEVTRWHLPTRSLSVELSSDSNSSSLDARMDEKHRHAFATFPRNSSPPSQLWKTGSLRLPRETQNDSGSFSIESEDVVVPFHSQLLRRLQLQRHLPAPPQPSSTSDGTTPRSLTTIPQQQQQQTALGLPCQRISANSSARC